MAAYIQKIVIQAIASGFARVEDYSMERHCIGFLSLFSLFWRD